MFQAIGDDTFSYPPRVLRSKLFLPHLIPMLLHTLSTTPAFTQPAPLPNIVAQWQNASSAPAYLELLSLILPCTTSFIAEHALWLHADELELISLETDLQAAAREEHREPCTAYLGTWRDVQTSVEQKTASVQRANEKMDALRRVSELLVDLAGLLGRAVVVEGEADEQRAVGLGLIHERGEAKVRLEALRVEVMGVAGRLETIWGELVDSGAMRQSEEMRDAVEKCTDQEQRRLDQAGEPSVRRQVERDLKQDDIQDIALSSIKSVQVGFRPGSPPRSPPSWPRRLLKLRDDEVGIGSRQQDLPAEMSSRGSEENKAEIKNEYEPEDIFRMSP